MSRNMLISLADIVWLFGGVLFQFPIDKSKHQENDAAYRLISFHLEKLRRYPGNATVITT